MSSSNAKEDSEDVNGIQTEDQGIEPANESQNGSVAEGETEVHNIPQEDGLGERDVRVEFAGVDSLIDPVNNEEQVQVQQVNMEVVTFPANRESDAEKDFDMPSNGEIKMPIEKIQVSF